MEILNSTQSVDLVNQKEPWYQLEVINQWDWGTKIVCYHMSKDVIITYRLKLNTPKNKDIFTSETVENITNEMGDALIEMGYTL